VENAPRSTQHRIRYTNTTRTFACRYTTIAVGLAVFLAATYWAAHAAVAIVTGMWP
jgi:hypothetical protein